MKNRCEDKRITQNQKKYCYWNSLNCHKMLIFKLLDIKIFKTMQSIVDNRMLGYSKTAI